MFEMRTEAITSPATAPYMGHIQLDYFKQKLLVWRDELVDSTRQTLYRLNDESGLPPIEEVERSVQALEHEIALQSQSRIWGLIKQIDAALNRIDDGNYGYCEESDEPIGFARLDANPVALYCLSIQEHIEKYPHAFH